MQGSADSRFCIRLSGADVVLGGEPAEPLDDSRGCIVDRANAKGFAFEYMTSGRAVVLGDIGPWACAGMTGGRVYVRVNAEWNLDREAIERRLGEGAKVELDELDAEGMLDLEDLLGHYAEELRATDQDDEAERVLGLAADAARELPDDRPAQGPGGPEHLDGVGAIREGRAPTSSDRDAARRRPRRGGSGRSRARRRRESGCPLDLLAVDEQAVEAAVVEDPELALRRS